MLKRRLAISTLAIVGLALASGSAIAQSYAGPTFPGGTPVDRNVGDFTPNAVSQRVVQPGNGQFGINSLLLDRYRADPHAAPGKDPFAGDPRIRHRFLLQMPGVTALMNQTEYIGLNKRGKWVKNKATRDGDEILMYSADTIFVLDYDMLHRLTHPPVERDESHDHFLIKSVKPKQIVSDQAYGSRVQYMTKDPLIKVRTPTKTEKVDERVQRDPNYVHPEIIERRRKLKEERQREEVEKYLRESQEASQTDAKTDGQRESVKQVEKETE